MTYKQPLIVLVGILLLLVSSITGALALTSGTVGAEPPLSEQFCTSYKAKKAQFNACVYGFNHHTAKQPCKQYSGAQKSACQFGDKRGDDPTSAGDGTADGSGDTSDDSKDDSTSKTVKEQVIDLKPGELNIPTASADNVLTGVLRLVYMAAGVVCVVTIIIGGIRYATSDGDPGKVKAARNAILYAVVGLVVIAMAFVITGFIAGRF